MFIRLLVAAALALAAGVVAAPAAMAVPPCWPDCDLEPIESYDPRGKWDRPTQDYNGTPYVWQDDDLVFTGWAGDLDAPAQAITVRLDVYRYDENDPLRRTVFDQSYFVVADQPRTDVPASYGPNHGYRAEIPTLKPLGGTPMRLIKVCMTAINVLGGSDAPLYPNHSAYQNSGNCYIWFYFE